MRELIILYVFVYLSECKTVVLLSQLFIVLIKGLGRIITESVLLLECLQFLMFNVRDSQQVFPNYDSELLRYSLLDQMEDIGIFLVVLVVPDAPQH